MNLRVSLALCLPAILWRPVPSLGQERPRFETIEEPSAWKLLPRERQPLPQWARMLAKYLPGATGGMLELDHVHRVRNPLGPVVAAKLRWAAADALGCTYGRRYAEADLRWFGVRPSWLKQLAEDPEKLPEADRRLLAFARKATLAASTLTDAEVADLVALYGPEAVVAMAHTIACANFQNRIFLALGVQVEPDGPIPPFDPRLDVKSSEKLQVPKRPSLQEALQSGEKNAADVRPAWRKIDASALEKSLQGQQKRTGRVSPPGPEMLAELPPQEQARAGKVLWTQVSLGYQPLLTRAWFGCMGRFRAEADLDRVFGNTVFWVVTRSNECFY